MEEGGHLYQNLPDTRLYIETDDVTFVRLSVLSPPHIMAVLLLGSGYAG